MNEVKLHILTTDYVGTFAPEDVPPLQYPKFDYDTAGKLSTAAMAYHSGTLYTDTPPDQWQPVDVDRAAALGYGERIPFEFPGPPIRVDDLTSRYQIEQARRNLIAQFNTYMMPLYTATLHTGVVRVIHHSTGHEVALPLGMVDGLSVQRFITEIKVRLK